MVVLFGEGLSTRIMYRGMIFAIAGTQDKRSFRILTLIDEFTKESLALEARRRFTSLDVIEVLSEFLITRGLSEYIRSDNEPVFTSLRQSKNSLIVWKLFHGQSS
jgi:hypothetical protein